MRLILFLNKKGLSMRKKYELTDETITYKGHILHRIRALKKFLRVEKGELGGFVESEKNLAQTGSCWIASNAKAYEEALVMDSAVLYEKAEVFGEATVSGYAHMEHQARAYGNACVADNACMYNVSRIYGSGCLCEQALLREHAKVYGIAAVANRAVIAGYARVNSEFINDPVYISNNAIISSYSDYIVCGPLGENREIWTAYLSKGDIYIGAPSYSLTLELTEESMRDGLWHDASPEVKLFFQMVRAKFGK